MPLGGRHRLQPSAQDSRYLPADGRKGDRRKLQVTPAAATRSGTASQRGPVSHLWPPVGGRRGEASPTTSGRRQMSTLVLVHRVGAETHWAEPRAVGPQPQNFTPESRGCEVKPSHSRAVPALHRPRGPTPGLPGREGLRPVSRVPRPRLT